MKSRIEENDVMETAKITSVKAYVLKIPVRIRLSSGEVKRTNHLITEIHTDNGIIGIGEGTPYALRGKSSTSIYNAYVLCRKIARKLMGKELSEAEDIKTVTVSEFIETYSANKEIPKIFSGSWINHNFRVWITRAWNDFPSRFSQFLTSFAFHNLLVQFIKQLSVCFVHVITSIRIVLIIQIKHFL